MIPISSDGEQVDNHGLGNAVASGLDGPVLDSVPTATLSIAMFRFPRGAIETALRSAFS